MQVIFEDDIDGSEAEGTVTAAFNGVGYELDLSARNRDKLLKAFGPYVEAVRKISARSSSRRRQAISRSPERTPRTSSRKVSAR